MVFPLKTTALVLGIVASIILWSNDGVYATPTQYASDEEITKWVCICAHFYLFSNN